MNEKEKTYLIQNLENIKRNTENILQKIKDTELNDDFLTYLQNYSKTISELINNFYELINFNNAISNVREIMELLNNEDMAKIRSFLYNFLRTANDIENIYHAMKMVKRGDEK